MTAPEFIEAYAEAALTGERYRGRWPRGWELAVDFMSLTWSDEGI